MEFTHYQWFLQRMFITLKRLKYAKIALTALIMRNIVINTEKFGH
jgi:hypothetical protein